MELNMYSVYDRKARIYNSPYVLANDQMAIRSFRLIVNDKESMVHHYPEDFVLYRIGKFNSNTGNLDTEGGPVEIYRDTIGGE